MKWSGKIGFAGTVETEPSVYEETITEKAYYGEVLENNRRLVTGEGVNDDVTISNRLSVVAKPDGADHIYEMRYATLYGHKWKITDVQVNYPRLTLTLGGLWNG